MSKFKIASRWISTKGTSEPDLTLCRLQISLAGRNVTHYTSDFGGDADNLEIPAYYLAEWFAENWWSLLWEPRKTEEGDDADFLARHSILTAQQGYALPRILIVSVGKNIQVVASARDVQFADIRFRNASSAVISRPELQGELRSFIGKVVSRLNERGISHTSLQSAWQLVEDTSEDEALFCRMIGALGLSPYAANDAIEAELDNALSELGERLTMDLCLASTAENFISSAKDAQRGYALTDAAPASTLEPLGSTTVPAENFAIPAWRRGVQAAHKAREILGIKDTDPCGSDMLFEKLKIETRTGSDSSLDVGEFGAIVGAVAREGHAAKIGLLQQKDTQRRFAAARAAYTAWASENQKESRFLTLAVTRDQQASRAFAAELTAPLAYLRAHSKRSKLSQDAVFELAANLNIGATVVEKQAVNNGLQIYRS